MSLLETSRLSRRWGASVCASSASHTSGTPLTPAAGDIGQILPNGVIKVIDRKKNLIKLSQGEYIALEHLENVFGITPIVDDIWVYGDSFKPTLVAVVVLHEENTMKWANSNGYKGSFPEICCLEQLRQHVLLELKSTGERNKLRGFEYIKGVILESNNLPISHN